MANMFLLCYFWTCQGGGATPPSPVPKMSVHAAKIPFPHELLALKILFEGKINKYPTYMQTRLSYYYVTEKIIGFDYGYENLGSGIYIWDLIRAMVYILVALAFLLKNYALSGVFGKFPLCNYIILPYIPPFLYDFIKDEYFPENHKIFHDKTGQKWVNFPNLLCKLSKNGKRLFPG